MQLLKVLDKYPKDQDSIYLVELNEDTNKILRYIQVNLEKDKSNIALRISGEEKLIDFHIRHATCIKVLFKNQIGWTNISFFSEM
jgi:hypothetical protein